MSSELLGIETIQVYEIRAGERCKEKQGCSVINQRASVEQPLYT